MKCDARNRIVISLSVRDLTIHNVLIMKDIRMGDNQVFYMTRRLRHARLISGSPRKDVPVADPGFPRGGGANPKGGAPTYYLANFSRKLYENEEILGQRGARVPRGPPLDPPLRTVHLHL